MLKKLINNYAFEKTKHLELSDTFLEHRQIFQIVFRYLKHLDRLKDWRTYSKIINNHNFILDKEDILKLIIQWGLFIWAKKPREGIPNFTAKFQICSPFDEEKTEEDKFKAMLNETCLEAISRLNSVPFDFNSYINEVLESDSSSVIEQDLVSFFMKMLRPIPEEERKDLSTNIWEKISPYIVII